MGEPVQQIKLLAFFDLLLFKTKANIRTEVSRYYLNYLWWAIEPVLTMLIFYVVFATLLKQGKENYTAFLLCGQVSWNWFARTVNNSAGSILSGQDLMLQVNIHKVFFPLEVVLRDTFKHLFVLGLLLVFLLFHPASASPSWLALPLLFAVQFVLNAGMAMICAALVPFVPDLRFVIDTILNLGMFASGIFFSIEDVVLPEHQFIMYLNPMAGLIKSYRDILIYSQPPDWGYLGSVLLASIGICAAGFLLIAKNNNVYPRICQR